VKHFSANGLMKRHLDDLLADWPHDATSSTPNVRMVTGKDGRDLLQMRVDMGILQLETTGRPDGEQFEGFESVLEYLRNEQLQDTDRILTEEECNEVDREFMQFYHRRMCWLRLQFYHRAVMDADHTLQLMDLSDRMSPDEEWSGTHEQYRPFVLFHRTQAAALGALEDNSAEEAVQEINIGLETIRQFFVKYEAEEHFDTDELVVRLVELRESLRSEYAVGRTLKEQLAEAVALEQYELAAKIRDELSRRDMN
jgi:UvrB/uvrC motif